MAHAQLPVIERPHVLTMRRDAWWIQPVVVGTVLLSFVVYATWAAFQNGHYRFGPYLSPFYSPELFGDSPHAWFGPKPGWWPGWLPFSPALLILPFPGRFRFTCYYYRGAYYKAFWADPPSCAVGEPRKTYRGEHSFPLILQNIHRYFMYLALLFLVILAHDVWDALWFADPATGRTHVRHRRRHARPGRQRRAAQSATPSAATRCATSSAAGSISSPTARCAHQLLRLRQLPQPPAHDVGLDEPLRGRLRRSLRPPVLHGRLARLRGSSDMPCRDYRNATSTTCSSSAPAAPGLRAAIEASAAGVSVGLVCKSLLGKAHTVMAEGGIAAAMGNVDDRDNWKVHFADTMRGGQYLNNWRMAELHAKEAPGRVRELEAWGARVRSHAGRPDPAAQLRRPPLPAPRPRRRPHRPGDDPHAAGSRHPPGHRRPHGVHHRHAAQGRRPRRRRVRLRPRARPLHVCSRPRPSCSPPAASAARTRSPATAGNTPATATRSPTTPAPSCMDMEFVQFHPTGMVWPPSVRGILVTEGVRGEGGVLRNNEGRRFMFDDIPENYRAQTADNAEEGWRYTQGDKNARRPPELLTRDHVARCIMREVEGRPRQPARRRVPRHRLDQGEDSRTPPEHIKKKLPSMYHQFKQLADIDITKEPMEVGPTTHYIMGGVRVDGDTQMSTRARPLRRRRVRRRSARREPPGRQLALRPARLRQARGRACRRTSRRTHGRRRSMRARSRRCGAAGPRAVRARPRRRGPVPGPARRCRT